VRPATEAEIAAFAGPEAAAMLVADDGAPAGRALVADGVLLTLDVARGGDAVAAVLVRAAEEQARRGGATTLRIGAAADPALLAALGYRETGEGFAKALPPPIARRAPVDGLYGRRRVHGHRLPEGYGAYALDLAQPYGAALFGPVHAVRLEVGFGGGEHLLHEARRHPDVGHIGAEPFESGIRGMVDTMRAEGIRNLRLFNGDARRVLEWLPPGALDRIDVLYPDPWHKQRHWKRRFISADGLDRLARVLRPGGTVRVASDIAGYVEWTRAHVAAHPAFTLSGDSAEPWEGWPGTRYEDKARREGRASRYLTLRRT
jgi:tRNA (guanine-N7-)-methyltransferase